MKLYKLNFKNEIEEIENCIGETKHYYIFEGKYSNFKERKTEYYITRKEAVEQLIDLKQKKLAMLRATLEELPDRIATLHDQIIDLKKEL